MYHGLHKNTVFNIDYKKTDTEVWSNDADNSALHHMNKLHFRIKGCFNLKYFNILCSFDQIIAAYLCMKDPRSITNKTCLPYIF